MLLDRKIPKVSIVIPSWFIPGQNGRHGENETFWFAQECLNRLVSVTPRGMYELIIVDNGSIPFNSEDVFDHYFSRADVLIRNKENLGFGPACNQGFALARGEYVCCLNNDILMWEGWLEALLYIFGLGLTPPAGVVMPALERTAKSPKEALELAAPDLRSNFNEAGIGAEFGSCWLMPRTLLEELKKKDGYYFDENFKIGFGEDRDLWDRVRLLGYQTYRCHRTRVYHLGNLSMTKVENRKDYTTKNREYLQSKRDNRKKYVDETNHA